MALEILLLIWEPFIPVRTLEIAELHTPTALSFQKKALTLSHLYLSGLRSHSWPLYLYFRLFS